MNPRVEDLESRRLMAVAATPFALIRRFDAAEHLAAIAPLHAHDLRVEALRNALEGRLGLAERRLDLAEHLPETRRPHAVDYWTSVVHTYRHALGIDAPTGVGQTLGTATPATVPSVTVDSTSGPTATEGGQPGLFTIHGVGVTVPVNFQVAASGADTTFDDWLYSINFSTGAISPITVTPAGNGFWKGSVSIPSGQSSVGIKLVEGDDSSATEAPGIEQDTLSILPPSGGCGCGGSSYAQGSPSSASITLVDNDVTIKGPANSVHASEGSPPVSQAFTIARSGDPSAEITVQLSAAGSTAAPGVLYDYAATAVVNGVMLSPAASLGATGGSVVIPAGASSTTLTITPKDLVDNGTGTSQVVNLAVLDDSCCNSLGIGYGYGGDNPSSATMTLDDPDGGTPAITLTASPATAVEDGPPGVFTITRTGDDGTLAIPYSFTGTAGSPADYTIATSPGISLSGGKITFQDMYSSGTVTVTPVGEIASKTAILNLTPYAGCGCCCGGGGAYTIPGPNSATVTLTDAPLRNIVGDAIAASQSNIFSGVVATFKDSDPQASPGDTTAQITWNNGDPASTGRIVVDPNDATTFDVWVDGKVFSSAGPIAALLTLVQAGIQYTQPLAGIAASTTPTINYQSLSAATNSSTGPFFDIVGGAAVVTAVAPTPIAGTPAKVIDSVAWSVAGTVYTGQYISPTTGFINGIFVPSLVTSATINFDWDENGSATARTITAVVKYTDGTTGPATTINITVQSATGTINPLGSNGGDPTITLDASQYPYLISPAAPGFSWNAYLNPNPTATYKGSFNVLQTVVTDMERVWRTTYYITYYPNIVTVTHKERFMWRSNGAGGAVFPSPLLDINTGTPPSVPATTGPIFYVPVDGTAPTSLTGLRTAISGVDQPDVPLEKDYDNYSRIDDFKDTLMYKPASGIYVPLGNLTWGYNVGAINPTGSGYNYTSIVKGGPTYTNSYMASASWPVWSDNTQRLIPNKWYEYFTQ